MPKQLFAGGLINVGDEGERPPHSLSFAQNARFAPDSNTLLTEYGRHKLNAVAPGTGPSSLAVLDFANADDLLLLLQNNAFYTSPIDQSITFSAFLDQKFHVNDADVALTRATPPTIPLSSIRYSNTWIVADGTGRPIIAEVNGRGRLLGLIPPEAPLTLTTQTASGFGNPTATAIFPVAGRITDVKAGGDTGDVSGTPGVGGGGFPLEAATDLNANTGVGILSRFNSQSYGTVQGRRSTTPVHSGFVIVMDTANTGAHADGLFLEFVMSGRAAHAARWAFDVFYWDASLTDAMTAADVELVPASGSNRAWWKVVDTAARWDPRNEANQWKHLASVDPDTRGNTTILRYLIPGSEASALKVQDLSFLFFITPRHSLDDDDFAFVDILEARVNDITGSNLTNAITTTTGVRYGYTLVRKYAVDLPDSLDPAIPVIESNMSPMSPREGSDPLMLTGIDRVTIERADDGDAAATHWYLYRSTDAASNAGTLDPYSWSKIGEFPIETTIVHDQFDVDGHPLDYQGPLERPPFLTIGGAIIGSHTPPLGSVDVVGEFLGIARYASYKVPGRHWWSRPRQPDYVPELYTDFVNGTVTAFRDLGVDVVFTDQEVVSYSRLPLASDTTFVPQRNKRIVSPGRGCLSRRGVVVFAAPGREPLAIFVAVDGLYVTNGLQAAPWSRQLSWPTTVFPAALSTAELIHDVTERRLLLTYTDKDGLRQTLFFYYDRPGLPQVVLGPTRWPHDATAAVIDNGVSQVISVESGIAYKEKEGTFDAALLYNASGEIPIAWTTNQVYPIEGRVTGELTTLGLKCEALPGVTVRATIIYRVDDNEEEELPITFDLSRPGWKWKHANVWCQSFRVRFDQNVGAANLAAWDYEWVPKARAQGTGRQ